MTMIVNGQDLRPRLEQHLDWAEVYLTPDLCLALHTPAQALQLADLLRAAAAHLDEVRVSEALRLDRQEGRAMNLASLVERLRWGSSTQPVFPEDAA